MCLSTLELHFDSSTFTLEWLGFFEAIAKAFPNLSSLIFGGYPHEPLNMMVQDLLGPLYKLPLTRLALPDFPYAFSGAEIGNMLRAWPHLRYLRLAWPQTVLDPSTLLPQIVDHKSLESIFLRLEINHLFGPLSLNLISPPKSAIRRSQLKNICLFEPRVIPLTLNEKATFVRNLLALFPSLNSLRLLPGVKYSNLEDELRMLLVALKATYEDGYRARAEEENN
ncbi:hypothetical protein NP233_g2442 [Leucocoprinus birnbaumii]|uniref:Uncharacterized protein n=1 Tax=Leucocoprinus birnbaumii TaxID=56174 RepID=A0AAD5VYY3_9AGAR|nr:hypothetical protein NP233_g2442 [Leucocoprinus birnbaumii]